MTPSSSPGASATSSVATVGGGCFWCTEAVFSELRGVLGVMPGYAGGTVPHPTYEQVCGGRTGHAEVVQITFDPEILSYRDLLTIFMTTHDPTTKNRQGADVGTQYRSIVLYQNEAQRGVAEEVLRSLDGQHLWRGKIVTELAPLTTFFPAEEYHHNYFARNPAQAYCQFVIAPKVAKLRKQYTDRLRTGST
ncbi:MAG: peptide-methionine (S)-S-oxide reductase MsrA [Thermoplasmata archaeon]